MGGTEIAYEGHTQTQESHWTKSKANKYKPRRQYDEDYKRQAVELTLHGKRNVRQVATELGVTESLLYEWRHRFAPRPGGGDTGAPRPLEEATAEITRLRTELGRMQERENMLKKSLGILSETPGSGLPRSRS